MTVMFEPTTIEKLAVGWLEARVDLQVAYAIADVWCMHVCLLCLSCAASDASFGTTSHEDPRVHAIIKY